MWRAVGRRLCGVSKASAWCLGDWLLYGQRAYGERYKTALIAAAIARHLDEE